MALDQKIEAIAFDIDGTLYPEFFLSLRIIPSLLKNFRFFWEYRKVRKIMHKTAPLADFFGFQARLLAEKLHCPVEDAALKIKNLIYEGFKPHFKKIRTFRGVHKLFFALKNRGYKIALLSDFAPEQKGDLWGLVPFCDLILGTESIGALKPSKYPFGILCQKLKIQAQNVLYVGNSLKYDVVGAKNAGMMAAYKIGFFERIFFKKRAIVAGADICFTNYAQLKKKLLD